MLPSSIKKLLIAMPILAAAGWEAYGLWWSASFPQVEIREVSPAHDSQQASLPFFELMSPVPTPAHFEVLPKLEYKKGPPERYLERISVLFQASPRHPKERIVYYGRHSRSDLWGVSAFAASPSPEARYVEAAIRLSQGEAVPELSGLTVFLYRPFLLREAAHWLAGAESVAIMDQAGTPAFLFSAARVPGGRSEATALFVRKNSFYRVDYQGDRGFSALDPETIFRKSFLTENRNDALEYVARNLLEVHFAREQKLAPSQATWPVLLLAAHLSIDPSSLESFFHFAGLNALLYRAESSPEADLELTDTLRNNVLAAELYAHDVAPEAPKALEIARLARFLKRGFEQ